MKDGDAKRAEEGKSEKGQGSTKRVESPESYLKILISLGKDFVWTKVD